MPFTDVPAFVCELDKRPSIAALAIEFAIMKVARIGEVPDASWSEIDLVSKVWTIPASA